MFIFPPPQYFSILCISILCNNVSGLSILQNRVSKYRSKYRRDSYYLLARDDKSFHFVSNFGGFRVCSPNGTRSSTRKDEKTKIDNRRDRSKGFLLDRSSSRLSPPPLLFFFFPSPLSPFLPHGSLFSWSMHACVVRRT